MHEHGPRPRSRAHARAHACAHAYAHAGAHAQRTRNAHTTHTHHVHRTRNTHAHARTHTRAHTHTRTRTQPRPRPQTHTQTPHRRRALNEITAAGLETRRPGRKAADMPSLRNKPDSFRIHPDSLQTLLGPPPAAVRKRAHPILQGGLSAKPARRRRNPPLSQPLPPH